MPNPVQAGGSGTKTALVAGALVALVASNVYLFVQLNGVRGDFVKFRETAQNEISTLKETSTVSTASNLRHIETLKSELAAARKEADASAGKARADAVQRAELLAKRLAEQQAKEHQQVSGEISEVKQVASAATTKLSDVSSDVSNVKTQVTSTQTELQKTIADLKRVTGDLGVQSGLIATNGRELAALKRLGERNYFEFTIGKSKQPQRVGNITIQLKKTDPKRNKYTIDVMADDKRTEKKDKNVNEPVQFYVQKAHQPYEIVVNQVSKNQIVGYLSTPKDQVARN